jgi:RimJ/RimL family protein N-acetyltransferase
MRRNAGAALSLVEGEIITTERLRVVPLRAEDADEMFAVLDDERLHEFIGGRPATLIQLRDRYAKFAAGSGKPDEVWLNWIVRLRADAQPIGTVQATVSEGGRTAHVAWVIGVEWQRQGFASEAARALVDYLRGRGVNEIVAHVHPDHGASSVVAARAGLEPTDEEVDGEQVWRAR